MEELWGEFLPVPESQLISLKDRDEITAGSYVFRALDTPGHANHHMAYLLDGICFSGDVGGVRIDSLGARHLRAPMPPPEFHIEKWRGSIELLKREDISKIAPTHFGFYEDVSWHLDAVLKELDAVEKWMHEIMPMGMAIDELRTEFSLWAYQRSRELGVEDRSLDAFEKANPSGMSADGIKRYWDKHLAIED
jgi:glyoxylase-like metal-dependent hydrolase (beta-lactamase superfamily II)